MTGHPTLNAVEKSRLKKEAARQRRYAKAHPKQGIERHQAWRDENRDAYNAWYREHYAKNKERILESQRQYRKRKKEGKA